MLTKNCVRNANLLCKRYNRYHAKRFVHRQLLSGMFPFCGTLPSASTSDSLSNKACRANSTTHPAISVTICSNIIVSKSVNKTIIYTWSTSDLFFKHFFIKIANIAIRVANFREMKFETLRSLRLRRSLRRRGGGEWGGDIPLPSRLGVWGSVVSSPSGVRGPAENEFRAYKASQNACG